MLKVQLQIVWDCVWILVQDTPFWTYSFASAGLCQSWSNGHVLWIVQLDEISWAHPISSDLWNPLGWLYQRQRGSKSHFCGKETARWHASYLMMLQVEKAVGIFNTMRAEGCQMNTVPPWLAWQIKNHSWADDTDSMCHDCPEVVVLSLPFFIACQCMSHVLNFPRCFIQPSSKASPEQVKLIKLCRSMTRCGRSPNDEKVNGVKTAQGFSEILRRDLCSQMWSPFPSWSRRIVMLAGPSFFWSLLYSWILWLEKSLIVSLS